ncbi:MAG: hypothetical protein JXA43_02560, partial [Candidatus Diapherotrites archaeon]|nr:hypothetical protein [Candidatus Diapherotrites archaeon]
MERDLDPNNRFGEVEYEGEPWQDGEYYTGRRFFKQNLEFLNQADIDSEAIPDYIIENYDLCKDFNTAIEIGIPENWLRRKPELFRLTPNTLTKNFKALNDLGLTEEEVFTFIDKNLSERTDHELMSVIYSLAGIRAVDIDENDKIEIVSEKIFCEMSIPRAAMKYRQLREEGVDLPIDIRGLFYFNNSMKKINTFKEHGIKPPFGRGLFVRPVSELRERIAELDGRGVDLDEFKEILGFGEENYSIAKKMIENDKEGIYKKLRKLKFD